MLLSVAAGVGPRGLVQHSTDSLIDMGFRVEEEGPATTSQKRNQWCSVMIYVFLRG